MTVVKTIVFGLVLANVAFFLWAHGIAEGPEPAAGPPIPSLRLASEVPVSKPPGAVDGAAPAFEAPPPPLAATRCISIGPFRDVPEAAHAATMLRGGGYDPRQRVAEGDVWAGVWVYLPIPSTPSASAQLLQKLKSAGIDDAMEMPGPTDGSVISLGLFSEQKRAQARLAQAQSLGLSPGLAERKRTGNVYWIDVDLKPTDGTLNPADLQAEAGRITRLEIKSCPAPAPAATTPAAIAAPAGQPLPPGQSPAGPS